MTLTNTVDLEKFGVSLLSRRWINASIHEPSAIPRCTRQSAKANKSREQHDKSYSTTRMRSRCMVGKHRNLVKVVAKVSELTLESLWRKGYTDVTDNKTMEMKSE
jgi:hypothetical protein